MCVFWSYPPWHYPSNFFLVPPASFNFMFSFFVFSSSPSTELVLSKCKCVVHSSTINPPSAVPWQNWPSLSSNCQKLLSWGWGSSSAPLLSMLQCLLACYWSYTSNTAAGSSWVLRPVVSRKHCSQKSIPTLAPTILPTYLLQCSLRPGAAVEISVICNCFILTV